MASTAPVVALVAGYLAGLDSTTFHLGMYLARYEQDTYIDEDGEEIVYLWDPSERGQAYRRAKTYSDPLLFALLYLNKSLATDQTGYVVSFSDAHFDAYRWALCLMATKLPRRYRRHAWFWPRNAGKSSMFFKILVCWAACHGHRKFVFAVGGTDTQVQSHMDYLRNQFFNNPKLRRDFTIDGVCQLDPFKLGSRQVTDTLALVNGFRMRGASIGSNTLGTTDEEAARPDWIIFDDIERMEGGYSKVMIDKVKSLVIDGVFPMSDTAVVTWVGTNTVMDGLADQIINRLHRGLGDERTTAWIIQEMLNVHVQEPLVIDINGLERSFWEARWSTPELKEIREAGGTTWNKSFMNVALKDDSMFFTDRDFIPMQLQRHVEGIPVSEHNLVVCSVDPAVTDSKGKNAKTGITIGLFNTRTGVLTAAASVAGWWSRDERQQVLINLHRYWKFSVTIWETNMGGKELAHGTLYQNGQMIFGPKHQVYMVAQSVKTGYSDGIHALGTKENRFDELMDWYKQLPSLMFHLQMPGKDGKLQSNVGQLESELLNYSGDRTKSLVDTMDSWATLNRFLRHLSERPQADHGPRPMMGRRL